MGTCVWSMSYCGTCLSEMPLILASANLLTCVLSRVLPSVLCRRRGNTGHTIHSKCGGVSRYMLSNACKR